MKLGVESRLIPFIVSTILWAEQPPPLSPAEAEILVETLDKARLRPKIPAPRADTPDDQVVSSATVNPSLRNRCFRVLREVSPSCGILPRSYYPEGVTLSDTYPYASGGFADIWKGRLDRNQVCVKALRPQTPENLHKIKRVCGATSTRVSSF